MSLCLMILTLIESQWCILENRNDWYTWATVYGKETKLYSGYCSRLFRKEWLVVDGFNGWNHTLGKSCGFLYKALYFWDKSPLLFLALCIKHCIFGFVLFLCDWVSMRAFFYTGNMFIFLLAFHFEDLAFCYICNSTWW